MYSIKNNTENTLIIKKSKFICKLYKINDEIEAQKIIDDMNNKFKDATHICYSYICNNTIRNSDDGEPSGTAGLPIYNVLNMNNLNNILCLVIRYFGGIKLGAGGLTRAYSNSVIEALKTTEIIELIDGYNIEIEFDYNNSKNIDYILKDITILNKSYDNNIKYNFNISINTFELIKDNLNNYTISIKIIKKFLVEN